VNKKKRETTNWSEKALEKRATCARTVNEVDAGVTESGQKRESGRIVIVTSRQGRPAIHEKSSPPRRKIGVDSIGAQQQRKRSEDRLQKDKFYLKRRIGMEEAGDEGRVYYRSLEAVPDKIF